MDLAEYLAKYGERGYLVLRAILEEADSNWGGPGLGDFSFKGVKARLRSYGVEYNPAPLLSRLEKEYGVIETTYKSSNQHWWRITDREAIVEAIRRHEGLPPGEGGEDTRARLLRIQFYSLEPERILETLRRLARGRRMSEADRRRLRRIVFEDLPLLVRFLEEAEAEYEDVLAREIALAQSILEAAERLVAPRGGGGGPPRLGGGLKPLEYGREAGFEDL